MIETTAENKDLFVAAALAEMIYARNTNDQPISLQDISVQLDAPSLSLFTQQDVTDPGNAGASEEFSDLAAGGVVQSVNSYFYSDTGFVGAIVTQETERKLFSLALTRHSSLSPPGLTHGWPV